MIRTLVLAVSASMVSEIVGIGYAKTPNVLLIVADDLGWGDVSYPQLRGPGDLYEGSLLVETPRLAEMAVAGRRLHRFYAASPVCSPTRVSLLTGRHGRRHAIDRPLFLDDDGKLHNGEITVAEVARAVGYTTGHFGKWHVGSLTKHAYDMRRGRIGNYRHYSAPWDNGYDRSFVCENWMPSFDPYAHFPINGAAQSAYFTGPSGPGLESRVPADDRVRGKQESQIVVDQTLRFIEESIENDQPFFATVWFSTPHVPLIDTLAGDRPGLSPSERRYRGAVRAMDTQVGRLRDRLRELHIQENTLVIFTSDNGPASQQPGSAGGLRGRKASLYEGGLRTPTIVEWPGRTPAGSESLAPMTTNDVAPMLFALWGVAPVDDRPLDGRAVAGSFLGFGRSPPSAFHFCSAYSDQAMAMNERYKLVVSDEGSRSELYDLVVDPCESRNLLEDGKASLVTQQLAELRSELRAWYDSTETSRNRDDVAPLACGNRNALIVSDAELTHPLVKIGVDEYKAPVFEDAYRFSEGGFESDEHAWVVVERQYHTLRHDLVVDLRTSPNPVSTTSRSPGQIISAGTLVHSYLIHYDPIRSQPTDGLEVEVAFDESVIAVITSPERLYRSDQLAFASPRFPDRGASRGLDDSDGDHWSLSRNRRSLRLRMTATRSVDQVRVLTAAVLPGHAAVPAASAAPAKQPSY